MPKFTPGPWAVTEHVTGTMVVEAVSAPKAKRAVARCGGLPVVRQANARLIAAAPELYEALADALAELSPLMQAYRPEHYAAICGKARAALAKADGETP